MINTNLRATIVADDSKCRVIGIDPAIHRCITVTADGKVNIVATDEIVIDNAEQFISEGWQQEVGAIQDVEYEEPVEITQVPPVDKVKEND